MKKRSIKAPVQKKVARVPVVLQMEALECGAASLAMILAYYDRWIPLEQVRYDCGVSRDGSNARNVLLTARNYGLTAKGYRCEPETLREKGTFPCIIHWNFNHFVVLDGFQGKYAVLNDPARGKVKVTMDEFDRSFTGVCMIFEPSESFQPGGRRRSILSFIRARMNGTRTAALFTIIVTLLGYLFGLIQPGMTRFFMDRLLSGENRELLMPFLFILAGIGFLQILLVGIQGIYNLRLSGKMAAVGNSTYMWKVLKLPIVFFSQRMSGDIQGRQASNALIAETLVNTLSPLVLNAIMMIFYLVVMVRYSLLLTLVGVISMILNLGVSMMISRKRMEVMRVKLRDTGNLAATTMAGISQIETLKASGAEIGFFQKWSGYHAAVNAQEVSFQKIETWLNAIPALVSTIADSVIVVLGVWLAMHGNFTLGMITAFKQYLANFISPATEMINAGASIQEMRGEMERLEDVMNYPDDNRFAPDPAEGEKHEGKLKGELELKDITFGYSRLSPPLIEHFDLTLKPGHSVALVGMSGSGKSTISKLISGLYAPWSGEILFDGRPIQTIPKSVFTGSVAVVDQDIILFEDTIANNIRMWDQSIQDFEVILAARDAQLHEDILQRSGGYQARLSENGRDLSGGQRQRMEIARVLAQDPSIIIMDEATSALDARTECNLVRAVRERGITTIVVAHRLSTIRDCDEIIVLDHGKVVERGTHDELYQKGGVYTRMISSD
ncbi:MAG: NHLP family bacteriocin export ABC transporter peptidase/permease/ATPase subunit [Clostridia bacterium]|nr:NHLP family bacteriocin export ABC transporter peptidase/permease/ATPase subunit [Clostridia bacterium]